ncbi:MAG TPA: DUF488 domain-containing protein [Candidatus Methylomirabilis sp.]|nr:DUF488 domain-containing protein [Candidatus Methylomirabilis sp.]
MIKLKRVYENPAKEDGVRILVERLWPRGLAKEHAAIDMWLKDIAPSPELRKWFSHDPGKWKGFCEQYKKELDQNKDLINMLKEKIKEDTVTFVYAAKDEEHNSAVVLKMFIENLKE